MSNLISHPKQKSAVNLDSVGGIYHDAGKSKGIFFSYPAMNDENEFDIIWNFDTKEEASEVYNKILDRFITEID
jgi:hypothetical protein